MIFAALLFTLAAQDAPTPAEPPVEEVVVQAKLGLTTMLFDKGSDGRLRNCRVMVSSGSQKRDTAACQATPVCYARTVNQVTECREMTVFELAAAPGAGTLPSASLAAPLGFVLPKLSELKPTLGEGQAGPLGLQEPSRETERQRVKLPPLPRAPSDGPLIRVGPAKELGE